MFLDNSSSSYLKPATIDINQLEYIKEEHVEKSIDPERSLSFQTLKLTNGDTCWKLYERKSTLR